MTFSFQIDHYVNGMGFFFFDNLENYLHHAIAQSLQ